LRSREEPRSFYRLKTGRKLWSYSIEKQEEKAKEAKDESDIYSPKFLQHEVKDEFRLIILKFLTALKVMKENHS
jgi:hypothetical protein